MQPPGTWAAAKASFPGKSQVIFSFGLGLYIGIRGICPGFQKIEEECVDRSLRISAWALSLAVLVAALLSALGVRAGQVSAVPDIDPHVAFGSKNAPIVMEVFSDFQCPACKTLFVTTNRQVMDNYVSTGKVYFIHRDFPLPMHAHSQVAALYSRAAAHVGKFEVVEEALFNNQEKWEQSGDVDGTVAAVLSPAEMTRVRALVKGSTLSPLIQKDVALGKLDNVNQTPTTVFHAKGQTFPYAGVMNYDILRNFLDQLAAK
jgi:protein-disulfide isomerase